MNGLPLSRLPLLFFCLGGFSQIAQALLAREFLVAFHGNEISIGAFYGGWLGWIGLGAWMGTRRPAGDGIAPLAALLPLALAGQIVAIRLIRFLWETPTGEFIPLGNLLAVALLLTAPTGWILGLLFPMACKNQPNTGGVTTLYVMEALGALAGALLYVFVLVEHLHAWSILGITAAALGGAILAASPPGRRLAGALTLAAGLTLWLTPLGPYLQQEMERLRFQAVHPGLRLLASVESRLGHTALGARGEQFSVISDGRIGASFPNATRMAMEAAFFVSLADAPHRILLFGGVADGLATVLLTHPSVTRVVAVEEDRTAFDMIRPHLPFPLDDPRLSLNFSDGRAFVNRMEPTEKPDLALILTGDPSSARANRFFTREFYARLREVMAPHGVLCTRVGAASNYLGREVRSYSGATYHTLKAVFGHVMVVPGDQHTFCASNGPLASDPAILAQRYERNPPAGETPPGAFFAQWLPQARTTQLLQRLDDEEATLNTDLNPVTFFLNMVLWGKFTASGMGEFLDLARRLGPWPYLAPVLVFLAMFPLAPPGAKRDRLAIGFTLGILGAVAMAMQLMILLGFQSRVGHLFGHLALLNGVFMAGLALGARLPSPDGRPAPRLAAALTIMALLGWSFTPLLQASPTSGAWLFFAISTLTGIVAGSGFPLAVRLAAQSSPSPLQSGGLAEAADHLGGALGGLLAGGLLIPTLGFDGSGRLLAALTLLAIVPLLPMPAWFRHPALKHRLHPSFANVGLTGIAWFVLLTALLLGSVARQTAPGPRATFDASLLGQVSGSASFTQRETPFPHYLGSGNAQPATISLATLPVVPEVRGFAGPLNLLIALDADGILRGARLIESRETPSYIRGIDEWLASLTGRNLHLGPLRLDGLSGATVTSQAALKTINRATRAAMPVGFGTPPPDWRDADDRLPPASLAALLLVLLAIPVHLRGNRRERLLLLLAALLILGLAHNSLLTEVDMVNLSLGQSPSLTEGTTRWILLCGALLLGLAWGPVYCGLLCPFGAAQEFLSMAGRRLGIGRSPDPALDHSARQVKFLLLSAALALAWTTTRHDWLAFNPMQTLFATRQESQPWLMLAVIAAGSVIFFRYWCRFWCPLGALLALFNKLALLDPLTHGKRRFHHCDLGVGHPFDVDCPRCHRCLYPDPPPPVARRFLLPALLAATAGLILLHLTNAMEETPEGIGGWRRVDAKALGDRIASGDLVDHEASWYRPLPP
ncbi:MAG: 4Fe-4S binding protein [Magnetococcales bacterium]|nr:4Fe-4S binding protein [Magnetococcales bacterium]